MLKKLFLLGWIVCLLWAPFCYSKEHSVQDLTAKPVYVSMFKNGIGLIVAQAELPEASGVYRVRPLPSATMGSFWVSWPENLSLTNVKATQAQSIEQVTAANVHEVLEANIGETVDILLNHEDKVWQRVKIVDIPKQHDDPIVIPLDKNIIPIPTPPMRSDLLIIEDSIGLRAISKGWVQAVRGVDKELQFNIDRPKLENVVEFNSTMKENQSNSTEPFSVIITYLAKGIAWSPSYVVDISQEDKATITGKAVIINDLIPLEESEIELITGYPHIQFGEIESTFSLTPLQQIMERIRRGGEAGRERFDVTSNIMAQTPMYGRAFAMAAPQPSMPESPVTGESTEDLFFYELENVTLKKGERGYYPLFSGEIPYEHLYTWEIPDYTSQYNQYQQQNQPVGPQVVWHTLKLTNTTGNPWTTAPATTMKNGRILGQDTINYTPNNASTDLKITQAVSIKAEQNEYEVERNRNVATFYRNSYDLVTVKGELALTNYTDKPVTVEITKALSGEIQQADFEPKIVKLASGLRMVNPQSQLVWKLEVKPNKDNSVKVTYTFSVYVQS